MPIFLLLIRLLGLLVTSNSLRPKCLLICNWLLELASNGSFVLQLFQYVVYLLYNNIYFKNLTACVLNLYEKENLTPTLNSLVM